MEYGKFMESADGLSKGMQYQLLYTALLAECRAVASSTSDGAAAHALWKAVERCQALVHAMETAHEGIDHVYRVKLDGWEVPFLFGSRKRAEEALSIVGQEGLVEEVPLL